MIDTHAHLDVEAFDDDREEMLRRTFDSGVKAIIIPAIEPKFFERVISLSESEDRIYCAIGIHPHNANDCTDNALKEIEKLLDNKRVVGIGEIGLDYYYDFAPPDVQKAAFTAQLKIAKQAKLPIIVHNRNSDADLLEILEHEQDGTLTGVLHCFSGDESMLEKSLKLGFDVSFTANVTFNKSKTAPIAAIAPLDRVLLETDSPWMAPSPFRGKRNEPAYIIKTAEKLAEIKSITTKEVIDMTSQNALRLFKKMIIAILMLFVSVNVFAQREAPKEEEKALYHPYAKFIGIGPMIGTNTLVETQYQPKGDVDISYEGLFSYGASLQYGLLDFLTLEAAYMFSKNNKIVELNKAKGPSLHKSLNFSLHLSPNPYSRINFFGILGFAFMMNHFNDGVGGEYEYSDNRMALHSGLGFKINIPFEGTGLMVITAEWGLFFQLSHSKSYYCSVCTGESPVYYQVDASIFYSIPKFGIVFYPEFLYDIFGKEKPYMQ